MLSAVTARDEIEMMLRDYGAPDSIPEFDLDDALLRVAETQSLDELERVERELLGRSGALTLRLRRHAAAMRLERDLEQAFENAEAALDARLRELSR